MLRHLVPTVCMIASFLPPTGVAAAGFDLTATPPVAARHPRDVSVHGDRRIDDYFWLRERDTPAVRAYLEAENAYTEAVTAPTRPLADTLYREMVARIQETDTTAPVRDGGWLYYSRTEAGKQYPIHCRRALAPGSPEEVLLDLNTLAVEGQFLALGHYEVSDDGRLLAYSLDRDGSLTYELFVKDLTTGALVPQTVGRIAEVEWAADDDTLFLVIENEARRACRLDRYTLSTGARATLYTEDDELYDLGLHRSRDGAWLFASSESSETTEVRVLPAATPAGEWRLLLPREEGHEYYVDHRAGHFWIVTNRDAKNFRVVTAPVATPDPAHWTEVLPHRPAIAVQGLDLFSGHVVVEEREDGLPQLRVIDLATGAQHCIAFPEPTYEAGLEINPVFDTTVVRYSYQSLVSPPSIYDYDLVARTSTLVKEQPVHGFERASYRSERLFATAPDGTRVPISLVYRTDLRRDGPQPLLLYGYGSYGWAMPDYFSSTRLSLLDRGVIYAVAHVRGGGEMGEDWHDHGKMAEKMNTFTDFIACAEHLVAAGYTTPQQLAVSGGSAGGLLVCATLNLRPDLFHAALVDVPFVDVLNTMLDASLPLTTGEYLEWGDPNDPAEYAWMRAYSPYDNLAARPYPAMLINTSLHDSQVPYWEPAKYVARLRALRRGSDEGAAARETVAIAHSASDRGSSAPTAGPTATADATAACSPRLAPGEPLLLRTNLHAGHAGASGRYDSLHEAAFDYAFLLTALGLGE